MSKNKKILLVILTAMVPIVACSQNVLNYMQQGGARWVVGGEMDIVNSGLVKIDGVVSDGPGAQIVEGNLNRKVVRVVYDVATDGGTPATKNLGVALPAKALVTQNWTYVVTEFDGTGTIALQCEDSGNLDAAVSFVGTAAGTVVAGNATGAASAFVKGIGAACNVSAVVGGASALTAGKLLHFIEYVVHD